jgi:hypothetical protein
MSYIGNTATQQAFTPAVDFFNGNGSTTAFTLSRPVASVAQVQAVISNVPQKPGDAFTVSGNTITFTSAPPSGTQNIYVYYTSPITQVIAPGQGTVDTTALVDSSVTTAKIANAAVTTAKLSSTTGTGAVALASLPSFPTTIGVGGATASASGSGVSFPATQSASSDANTLDDYEEGTWSPNFTFSGASAGMSYTSSGTYTKIGNSVRVFGRVAFTNKGSSTGSAWIQNLPFVNSVSGQPVYFIVGSLTGISSQIQMYMDNGNTVYMEVIGSGSQTVLTNSNVTNTSTFYVSVFYSV